MSQDEFWLKRMGSPLVLHPKKDAIICIQSTVQRAQMQVVLCNIGWKRAGSAIGTLLKVPY